MARVVAFEEGYQATAHELGAHGGTKASRGVARVVRQLAGEDELPSPDDVRGLIPRKQPSGEGVDIWAYARRVPGVGWLWYWPTEGELRLFALTRSLSSPA